MRGFMTSHGQPDQSRSARYILKDYVSVRANKILYSNPLSKCFVASVNLLRSSCNKYIAFNNWIKTCLSLQGKLLYCNPPPAIHAKDFQPQHKKFLNEDFESSDLSATANKPKVKRIENVVDKNFFHQVYKVSGNWDYSKWLMTKISCVSPGECAGALQGGSVHHGLQARQRASRPRKSWIRRDGGKTLEKTRQQEQEGESATHYKTSGCLETITNCCICRLWLTEREAPGPEQGQNCPSLCLRIRGKQIWLQEWAVFVKRVFKSSQTALVKRSIIPSSGQKMFISQKNEL